MHHDHQALPCNVTGGRSNRQVAEFLCLLGSNRIQVGLHQQFLAGGPLDAPEALPAGAHNATETLRADGRHVATPSTVARERRLPTLEEVEKRLARLRARRRTLGFFDYSPYSWDQRTTAMRAFRIYKRLQGVRDPLRCVHSERPVPWNRYHD